MTKYYPLFIVFIFLLGCKNPENIINAYSHQDILKRTTKIVIERHKKVEGEYGKTFRKDGKVYNVKSEKQLRKFAELFKNGKLTSYCCCPETNYTISFYENDNFFGLYNVDTIQFKDSIRIYESGFQYSYIIEKKNWKEYLNEININN